MLSLYIKENHMGEIKRHFSEDEEEIIAIGEVILLIFIKLGLVGLVVYFVFNILSVLRP